MKISKRKRANVQRAQKMNEILRERNRNVLEPIDLNVQVQSKYKCGLAEPKMKSSQNENREIRSFVNNVPSETDSIHAMDRCENEKYLVPETATYQIMMTEANASVAEIISEDIAMHEVDPCENVKCLQPIITESDATVDQIMMEEISTFELNITSEPEEEIKDKSFGRRIISVGYFFEKIQEISKHSPCCTRSDLMLLSEKRKGLTSKFTFRCRMCNTELYIDNDNCDDNYLDINSCAVAGTIAIGCGQSQLAEFLSCVNAPIINENLYEDRHSLIGKHWKSVSIDTMKEAAEKERAFALAEGRVNKDGIPIIDVIADGCWSKRSYKKNYSALSGAATIIGKNTGKILFLGIRNKYCQLCAKTEREKSEPKKHICFKNYDGPSTAMESQIIVKGFKSSIQMHNLIYGRLISDGDSSTYAKILEIFDVTVEKIECRNHMIRNFCNKMQALTTETKYPIRFRKLITKTRVLSTRAAILKIIKKHKDGSDIQRLFEDLLSVHNHGFGDHTKCRSYFCDKIGVVMELPKDFYLSCLWERICFITQCLAAHARSLKHDVDSNVVENFHSVVAKFVGGKRINFSKKKSYDTRCYAAAVAFNTKKTISRLYKSINKGESPTGRIKTLEEKRITCSRLNKKNKKPKKRLNFIQAKTDIHYGEECVKEDVDDDTFEKLKSNFLDSLKKTDEERNSIEKATMLQSGSSEWLEMRRSKLTALNFGKIIKRRPDTSCAKAVKELLYKTNSLDNVLSIKHGRQNVNRALQQLAEQEHIKITPCGLFIDQNLPFLGATPDGICGEDTIIELKCLISAYNIGIEEAIKTKKVSFWKLDKQGSLIINKTHNWFYQVQGQLHITQRSKCLFAVWYSENAPLKTEIIFKDDEFWSQKMEPKLTQFYMNCILPELIDPRHPRNLPTRDPFYIQEAIKKKDSNKKKIRQ